MLLSPLHILILPLTHNDLMIHVFPYALYRMILSLHIMVLSFSYNDITTIYDVLNTIYKNAIPSKYDALTIFNYFTTLYKILNTL